MPSLTAKDRISLCLFSYEDGRRCRTPRIASHPHFCFYHAQKESQSQAAEKLADDLAYFFSGKYLTANDLNAALARLIPATIRGEIKPRLARTVAYMLQTLMQSTRQAQHEYINAFSTDGWRQAVRNSVQTNHDHLYPKPAPDESSADEPVADSTGSEQHATPAQQSAATTSPAAQAALNIARAIFPERPAQTETLTAVPTPTPTISPATPTQTAAPTNPPTQTVPPATPPPPPARRQQIGAPNRARTRTTTAPSTAST
jgi:hypothetical protein